MNSEVPDVPDTCVKLVQCPDDLAGPLFAEEACRMMKRNQQHFCTKMNAVWQCTYLGPETKIITARAQKVTLWVLGWSVSGDGVGRKCRGPV